jgi:hypothetical protein
MSNRVTKRNSGGGSSDHKVSIDIADTTFGFLATKLQAGTNISFTILNPGGNEILQINSTGGGSETLADVSSFSLDQADNTYTIPTDITVLFSSLDGFPFNDQVGVTSSANGYLGFLSYGPGDAEIHFDMQYLGGTYIANNDFISMIVEEGNQLQFFTGGGNTIGMPVSTLNLSMWIDGIGNMSILADMQDQGAVNSWDFNNRVGFADDGTTAIFQYVDLRNLFWGDVNGVGNGTYAHINDSLSIFEINGLGNGIVMSPVIFTGVGLNDITVTGSFSGTPPVSFDVTIDSAHNGTLHYATETGLFIPGETITDTSGSGAGSTATVILDTGTGTLTFRNQIIVGTGFAFTDTVVGSTSGFTFAISNKSVIHNPDTFSWTSSDGGSGSLINLTLLPTLLGDSISVNWAAVLGHTVTNQWDWSYTLTAGRILLTDSQNEIVEIGDVYNFINGTLLTIDIANELITLGSALGVVITELAGSGSGFVAVDNTGLLSWSAGSGGVPTLASVLSLSNLMGGTSIELSSFGDDYFTSSIGSVAVSDTIGNFVIDARDSGGAIQTLLSFDSNGQINYTDASVNSYLLLGTVTRVSTFGSPTAGDCTYITVDDTTGSLNFYTNGVNTGISASYFTAQYNFGDLQSAHGMYIDGTTGTTIIDSYGITQFSVSDNTGIQQIGDIGFDWFEDKLYIDGPNRRMTLQDLGFSYLVIDVGLHEYAIGDTGGAYNSSYFLIDDNALYAYFYQSRLVTIQTNLPTISLDANAGTGATSSITSATDVAGIFSVTSGTGTSPGSILTVNFFHSYVNIPTITITPLDVNSAGELPFWITVTTAGFTIWSTIPLNTLGGVTYSWNYQVIGL